MNDIEVWEDATRAAFGDDAPEMFIGMAWDAGAREAERLWFWVKMENGQLESYEMNSGRLGLEPGYSGTTSGDSWYTAMTATTRRL